MGRRAKTKQGPPEPLYDPRESIKPSRRELGKRKAEPEPEDSKRPAKKAKETSTKKEGSKGVKGATEVNKGKGKGKGKKGQQSLATSWDDADAAGGNGGWEDVDDDDDVQAQAQ